MIDDARSGRRLGVGLLVVLIAATSCSATRGSGRPGGDPGGRILHALEPVQVVVPADSAMVTTTDSDSTYSMKCPDNPSGKSGWSAVTVVSTFRSPLPSDGLIRAIGNKLTRRGWHTDITPSADTNFDQFPVEASWHTKLLPGQAATAALYQVPPGNGRLTGQWTFSAEAKPPGFALPGC